MPDFLDTCTLPGLPSRPNTPDARHPTPDAKFSKRQSTTDMAEFVIFFVFAAIAVVFALVVVLHRNPVVGALSLVASFFALAVMYVLLEAPFLAALQVIVYAGAIMVLFLFVIMLLNLQHAAEPATRPVQQFLGYTS